MPDGTASHLPILDTIAKNKQLYTALEFGVGMFSTPALLDYGCDLTSVELKQPWLKKVEQSLSTEQLSRWLPYCVDHEFYAMPDLISQYFDLVLIDGGAFEERRALTQALLTCNCSSLYLLHDSERAEYLYHVIVIPPGFYALRIEPPGQYPWSTIITEEPLWKSLFSSQYPCSYYDSSTALFTRMGFPAISAYKGA